MDGLYLDDGFTLTDHMAAAPGMHPAVELVYRPALPRVRLEYQARTAARDVDALERFEVDLLAKHLKSVNGSQPTADQLRRMHPVVRDRAVGLVLSLTAAHEGNSPGA